MSPSTHRIFIEDGNSSWKSRFAVADVLSAATSKLSSTASTPAGAFGAALAILCASAAALWMYGCVVERRRSGYGGGGGDDDVDIKRSEKDPRVASLRRRFLAIFWLLRMADWLQGPYFYQVYASKNFGVAWVSRLFLAGFASTALFGPIVGRMCDTYGRRAGTIAFSFLCGLGACSTESDVLGVLIFGRLVGGIGSSLLHCAPEAWLVGEAGRMGIGSSLCETFGLAYAGDSIVAILAGQMAEAAASSRRGPTGPFELSVAFLVLGGLLASLMWRENVAGGGGGEDDGAKSKDAGVVVVAKPTIRDAIDVVKSDPKIMLVGAIQSMFEAAMYIFVLSWPPAVSGAVKSYFSKFATANSSPSAIGTPYGTVFSCFMACCLLGSTVFGRLTSSTGRVDARTGKVRRAMSTESFAVGMLALATTAMGIATLSIGSSAPPIFGTLTSLPILSAVLSPVAAVCGNISTSMSSPGVILSVLMLSLFLFESCVGMYFPTIGTLRSKYFPDSHRSVVMNLFGIPLNAMVVTAILSIETLGVHGCLGISTAALAVATACGLKLKELVEQEVEGEKGGESMIRVS